MKRKIALLLSLIMLMGLMFPASLFAADKDNGLENALTAAKSIFTIPDSYTEFNYNVNMNDGGRKIWYLSWSSKDGADGSMNVNVDDRGTIISYYSYKPSDYTQRKFPKVSKAEARTKAADFIKKVNPAAYANIRQQDDNSYTPINSDYYFNYIRLVNGIPCPDNNIYVSVNSETGEVMNYNYNWNDDLVFPAADQAISLAAAQQAYKDELGLKLVYNQYYNGSDAKALAVYVPKFDTTYYLDALTGKQLRLNPYWYGYGMGGGGAMYDKVKMQNSAAVPAAVTLTPQEIKAIEDVSQLLSQDEAEAKVRAFTELGLTSDYKLSSAGLSKDWPVQTNFTWNLNFTKDGADPNKEVTSVSASLDAKTGEIKSFYRGFPYNADDVVKYDEAQSKAAVEQFLQSFAPDKFKDAIFDDTVNNVYLKSAGKEPQRQYSFNYLRKVNGIPFTANSINVGFDAVYGKITNLSINWYDLDFPSIDKVVSMDSVYDKLFSDIGLELEYRFDYDPGTAAANAPIMKPNTKPVPRLVYAVKQGKPLSFDANTGAIIDFNGQPYKETKPVEYTDIQGSFAQSQIEALAQYGIALEGTEFKPAQDITQLDFMRLLAKSLNYYSSSDPSKETDDLYRFLTQQGVVKDGEKAPDANVSREDAVKFIIRALKYDKVADINGIYKIGFKDAGSISENLTGYIAIATGLNIIKGNPDGTFAPKSKLTRAQAAVIIYNYLQN